MIQETKARLELMKKLGLLTENDNYTKAEPTTPAGAKPKMLLHR